MRPTLPKSWSALLLLLPASLALAQEAPDPRDTDLGPRPASLALSTVVAPPVFTVLPVLVPNPNPDVPLAATITLATNVPTRIELRIDDGFRTLSIPDAEKAFKTEHAVLVLGVHPDRSNRITVVAFDPDGKRAVSNPLVFNTPPLPSGFPPIDVQLLRPGLMEPGFTLLGMRSSNADEYTVILDDSGQVAWFHQDAFGTIRFSNGDLLIHHTPMFTQEIDMLGNVVQGWYATGLGGPVPPGATPVALNTFHHEFSEFPRAESAKGADFLVLSNELRVYPNYPASYTNPGQVVPFANVIGDVVAEFARDGTLVRGKKLLDILDPYRLGYGSLLGGWDAVYGTSTLEWAHANSVVIDPEDGNYIVSLRDQDCIVKIRRDTPGTGSLADLVWILGTPDNWQAPWASKLLQPIGDFTPSLQSKIANGGPLRFEWQYHQHAAVLGFSGDLLCFDNGVSRVSPPQPVPPITGYYSRAVEFRVDPRHMTVEQKWAAGGWFDPDPYRIGYSFAMGNSEPLDVTGNVLVCAGGSVDFTTTPYTYFARVTEFQHSAPPVAVFDVTVRDPDPTVGWNCYRSYRLPSLYP